jgi:DNA-binding Lrp family transcriptional regulator
MQIIKFFLSYFSRIKIFISDYKKCRRLKQMQQIDEIDGKILQALIKNARTKLKDIAEDCGVSITAIKRRIDKMEKNELIVKSALLINMDSFGYPIMATIGIDIEQEQEQKIIELVQEYTKVAGINQTIGNYDLCLFVFAESINDLDKLKQKIRKQTGIQQIDVNIWHNNHFNYNNIII